jgi:hypothetical protein
MKLGTNQPMGPLTLAGERAEWPHLCHARWPPAPCLAAVLCVCLMAAVVPGARVSRIGRPAAEARLWSAVVAGGDWRQHLGSVARLRNDLAVSACDLAPSQNIADCCCACGAAFSSFPTIEGATACPSCVRVSQPAAFTTCCLCCAPSDFIGLDTCLSIMRVLHEQLGDSKYRCASWGSGQQASGPARQ